jgi:hypothetical protein
MDKGIKEMTYMWRELNDNWYRIQTNSPTVIDKLKRRKDAKICGKTTSGSTVYWLIFRVKYNKPSTARQSFKRLTNCKKNFKDRNGLISAETSTSGSTNPRGEV